MQREGVVQSLQGRLDGDITRTPMQRHHHQIIKYPATMLGQQQWAQKTGADITHTNTISSFFQSHIRISAINTIILTQITWEYWRYWPRTRSSAAQFGHTRVDAGSTTLTKSFLKRNFKVCCSAPTMDQLEGILRRLLGPSAISY